MTASVADRDANASAEPATVQPPSNPVRRIVLVTVNLLLLLFAYSVLSDRFTPLHFACAR